MRYRIFGNTGLRVSTLALGTGNFGNGWGYGADKEEARHIYTRYREAGGNFIDTADQYQFGQSETMLSDFIATERDDIVLATKFSLGDSPEAGLQRSGNSRKSMVNSLEASLKRLKTDHIDLLWVHMPDGVTPVDQIARALDDVQVKFSTPGFLMSRHGVSQPLPPWLNFAAGLLYPRCSWNTVWWNARQNASCCLWRRLLTWVW